MVKIQLGFFLLLSACISAPAIFEPERSSAPVAPQSGAEIRFIKAALDPLQARSIAEDREYCGYLGLAADGALAITPPKQGNLDSCTPPDPPAGFRPIASYHTHAAYSYDYDSEIPSAEDLEGDMLEQVNGYVATPGGRLWFNDANAGETRLICGLGCLTSDPRFLPDPAYPVGNAYTLGALWGRQN